LSKWPGGRDAVIDSVQSKLRAISSMALVSRDSTGVQHQIVVGASPLRLGAVRPTYGTQVTSRIHVYGVPHDFPLFPKDADPAEIATAVEEAIVSKCGVDDADATVTVEAPQNLALDPLQLNVKLTVRGGSSIDAIESDWLIKLAKAKSEMSRLVKLVNNAKPNSKFDVATDIPVATKTVNTITMDFTVHGVDYTDLKLGKKAAFLNAFAEGVRQGFNYDQPGFPGKKYGDIQNVLDDIQVVVSSNEPVGSVRVRVEIPAPPIPPGSAKPGTAQLALMSRLEKDSDTLLKTHLQDELRKVDGINYLSTWTQGNIHVTMPGHNL